MRTILVLASALAVTAAAAPPKPASPRSADSAAVPGVQGIGVEIPPPGPSTEELRLMHQEEFRNRPYQGHQIHTNPDIKDVDAGIQAQIAARINRADMVPPQRAAHFAKFAAGAIRVNGWSGIISRVTPVAGGFEVDINVVPVLDNKVGGFEVHTGDYVIETYFVGAQGGIRYLGGAPAPDRVPGVLVL